jgi:hypothetical protein
MHVMFNDIKQIHVGFADALFEFDLEHGALHGLALSHFAHIPRLLHRGHLP